MFAEGIRMNLFVNLAAREVLLNATHFLPTVSLSLTLRAYAPAPKAGIPWILQAVPEIRAAETHECAACHTEKERLIDSVQPKEITEA